MKDIVKRLKSVNEESLIMAVVRDCMDAAEEIERLHAEKEALARALQRITETINHQAQSSKNTKPSKT